MLYDGTSYRVHVQSLNFSNNFILIRVMVDLEHIPGTLSVMWEDTPWMGPQSITGYHSHKLHTLIHTQGQLVWQFGGVSPLEGEMKPENLKETHADSNPSSRLNPGPWSCEMTSLSIVLKGYVFELIQYYIGFLLSVRIRKDQLKYIK